MRLYVPAPLSLCSGTSLTGNVQDLEDEVDDQIANLKVAMEKACVADNEAREKGEAATHKLKLLPQVTALLNRTAVQDSVLDPETNLLQSVKYFLEPLNDGSL